MVDFKGFADSVYGLIAIFALLAVMLTQISILDTPSDYVVVIRLIPFVILAGFAFVIYRERVIGKKVI